MNALTAIAQAINAEHAAAHADARSALERARKCGELLLGAKAQTEHGQWLQWIESNLAFGARQAQKYMRLCEAWEQLPNANSDSLLPSIDAALATVAEVAPEREASPNGHAAHQSHRANDGAFGRRSSICGRSRAVPAAVQNRRGSIHRDSGWR